METSLCLSFCALYEVFPTATFGLPPFPLAPLPGQSWVTFPPPSQVHHNLTKQSFNFPSDSDFQSTEMTRLMVWRLFIPRSSPLPSLRLDHRVGSNGVKLQTYFLSRDFKQFFTLFLLHWSFSWQLKLRMYRFNLFIGATNASYIVQMVTILDQTWINQLQVMVLFS